MVKNILTCICIVSLLFNCVFGCCIYRYRQSVQSSRDAAEQYRVRVEQYERDYQQAINYNRQLREELDTERELVDRAKQYNIELGDSLQRASGSIKELRAILEEIRKYCKKMEMLLNSSNSGVCSNNDNSND